MTDVFPKLLRRESYPRKRDGEYYSDYNKYKGVIEEDCQFRCVYCDIKIGEMGNEGFQLDHFRPQRLFSELGSNPYNLVISCPKCNRLKSDDWPTGAPESYDDAGGYLDPFQENRLSHFKLASCGSLHSLTRPAEYMLQRLALNRESRRQMRRRRILIQRKRELFEECISLLRERDDLSGEIISLLEKMAPH